MRGILEAGIGGQRSRLGLRYAPGFTPFINIKDSEAKLKSLHTISLVLSLMWYPRPWPLLSTIPVSLREETSKIRQTRHRQVPCGEQRRAGLAGQSACQIKG